MIHQLYNPFNMDDIAWNRGSGTDWLARPYPSHTTEQYANNKSPSSMASIGKTLGSGFRDMLNIDE
ncbi:hypothetical protein BTA51_16060 [Hahella sp. CCB-MM4]|nr:hypothetical protein BTA51_16060 [Hahella sp. CCB-MM4]